MDYIIWSRVLYIYKNNLSWHFAVLFDSSIQPKYKFSKDDALLPCDSSYKRML